MLSASPQNAGEREARVGADRDRDHDHDADGEEEEQQPVEDSRSKTAGLR